MLSRVLAIMYKYRQGVFAPAERYSRVALGLSMAFLWSLPASAERYFAPEFLASDPQMVADLSRFEGGAQLPGIYLVDIYMNGKFGFSRNLQFIDAAGKAADVRDSTGLLACLRKQDLVELGVNTRVLALLHEVTEKQCLSPGTFIPGAFSTFDFQHMRLDVSVPQVAIANRVRDYIPPERWDDGINAGLLNYSFSGSSRRGRDEESRTWFLSMDVGLNLGAWRLRDYWNWSELSDRHQRDRNLQHVKTYVQRTIAPLRSEVVFGDSTTRGEFFKSLGVRGVQIFTDDSMYPDSQSGFAPLIRGIARSNARVSIRQNGYMVYETFVSPGSFAIDDLYPLYASGDLEVTVKEADGSTQITTVPYSSIPVLLREGRGKYNLVAGRYQSARSSDNNPPFLQGTLIWGLPYNITTYGGIQYSARYFSGLLGIGLDAGISGAFSVDLTRAWSTLVGGRRQRGQLMRFQYAYSLNSLGSSVQITASNVREGFYTLDETTLKEGAGWRYGTKPIDAEDESVPRQPGDDDSLYSDLRTKIEVSVSRQVSERDSIFLSAVHQRYRNGKGTSNSLLVGVNGALRKLSYSLNYSYLRYSNRRSVNRSFFLSVSVPLDVPSLYGRERQRTMYANYGMSKSVGKEITHQTSLSGTVFEENNLDWSISQGYTRSNASNGNLSTYYRGSAGNGRLGYSYSENWHQFSYGISGGAVLHSNGLTLGQPVGETSVLVAVPGLADISVESETGIRTDGRGYAIKPYAQPYRENRVALMTTELDEQTEIDDAVSQVIPTRGAMVRASFKGYTGSRVLMTLTSNGKPLPFGATATAGERLGIVGDDGQLYLSGIPKEGTVQVEWGSDKRCSVNYLLPADKGKYPVIRMSAECR